MVPANDDNPRFKLPLTHDEQVELLGLLLSYQARIQKLLELNEELNKQIQVVILELALEKKTEVS